MHKLGNKAKHKIHVLYKGLLSLIQKIYIHILQSLLTQCPTGRVDATEASTSDSVHDHETHSHITKSLYP